MSAYRWQLVKVGYVERLRVVLTVDGYFVGALRCWLIARSGLDICQTKPLLCELVRWPLCENGSVEISI